MAAVSSFLARFGPLTDLASYHLMLYGTLLGTELYQVIPPSPPANGASR